MRKLKTVTQAETRALVRRAVDLGSPNSFTIGEVQKSVASATGCDVGRASVENALMELVASGEALIELRSVTRNGFEVPNARHFYAKRSSSVEARGCGICPGCRAGGACDPFEGLTEDQRMVQESFRQALVNTKGRVAR